MTVQSVDDKTRSLWREQADRWLNFAQTMAPTGEFEPSDDDPDHDPPPAAPAMPPWPRVLPGL